MNIASGPLDSRLWIILDSPDEEELQANRPLVGNAGRFFSSIFSDCGYHLDRARIEYLIPKLAPKGEFRFFESKRELQDQVDGNVVALRQRIKEFSPNVVLLVGPNSLKYIAGKEESISDWRGHYIWLEDLGVKAIATYKPSVALRQRHVEKKQKPGQYETLLVADVRKAIHGEGFHETKFPDIKLNVQPTVDEAMGYLEDIEKNAVELSYDIETLNNVMIDCIGFAHTFSTGTCIPFWTTGGNNYWKSDKERLHVFRKVKDILESDTPKIAQNSQFDTVILLEYYGIDVRNIVCDTMLLAHNLYCDLPKDLGTLMSLYANLPYHKQMIHSSSNLDRWLYNAQDAVATLHVKRGLLLEDKELQNILPHYYLVTNPAIRVLVEMQKVGVKVNLEYIKEAIKHEHALAEEILYALDQVFPIKFGTDKKFIHKFNPGSSDQKQTLFYDLFGIRKKYNKGAVTTNKAFLTNLKETHSNPRVAFLAEVCEKYSLAASTGSQLSMPLYNGRMHTSYTLGGVSENEDGDDLGTDTGRLASKRSYFYVKDNVKGKWVQAGANLQNRKKGHQRRILTAEEGEEFCMVDLWAAEAYLVALDAQEEKLLAMLDRGEKCHNWLEQVTKAKFPDECDAAHYTYKDAKQGIHSMNYDAQPGIIANSSRLPGYVAEWQYNFYHGEFPGIKRRMLRVKDTIQRTKSITSFLGRKILFIQSWGDELLKRAYAWRSQSTIGEMAIIAMTKLNYVGKHFEPFMFPCLNTHDGLATRVKLGNRDAVTARMADAFNIPISYLGKIIRIPVEVSWGPNFNDVEKGTTKIVKYKEDGTWELH